MVYRDYLKRQIDQLGQVLGKLLADLIGLKTQGKVEQGIEIVSQTLKNKLDIDIEEILSLTETELIEKLVEKTESDNLVIGIFADIIFEIAESLDKGFEKEKRVQLFTKSLSLYEYVERKNANFSFDIHNKIEIIKEELKLQD